MRLEFGLMTQLSRLKFNPADFKLVFLPGKLFLLSSPLLREAPFGFDSTLLTFKAHCIAERRLKIFTSVLSRRPEELRGLRVVIPRNRLSTPTGARVGAIFRC